MTSSLSNLPMPKHKPIKVKAASAGSNANASGKLTEHIIKCVLECVGYSVQTQYKPGIRDIFGKSIRIDCFVEPCETFPRGLAIESKWQDASGSVIEKLPFLVENIKTVYPCPCIIVLDGEYICNSDVAAKAIDYLKSHKDGDRFLEVFSFQEFISWAINELKRGSYSPAPVTKQISLDF